MKKTALLLTLLAFCVVAAAPATAGEYEGKTDGPFMSIETIQVMPYGTPAYMEYLGKGYIPLLAMAKEEGLVLDYGVLEAVTGSSGDGNVIIWWLAESMGALQAANEFIGEKAGELHTDEEWAAMVGDMAEVRKPLSTRIMRVTTWQEKGAEAEGGGD